MEKFKQLLMKYLSAEQVAQIEKGEIDLDDAFQKINGKVVEDLLPSETKKIKREAEIQAAAMARSIVEKQLNEKFGLNLDLSKIEEKGRMDKVLDLAKQKLEDTKKDFDKQLEAAKEAATGDTQKKLIDLQATILTEREKANALQIDFANYKTESENAVAQKIAEVENKYLSIETQRKQQGYFDAHIKEITKSAEFNVGDKRKLVWSDDLVKDVLSLTLSKKGWEYKAIEKDGNVIHSIVDKEGNLVKEQGSMNPISLKNILIEKATAEKAILQSEGKPPTIIDYKKSETGVKVIHPNALK